MSVAQVPEGFQVRLQVVAVCHVDSRRFAAAGRQERRHPHEYDGDDAVSERTERLVPGHAHDVIAVQRQLQEHDLLVRASVDRASVVNSSGNYKNMIYSSVPRSIEHQL